MKKVPGASQLGLTATVYSSHGELTIGRSTGNVLTKELYDEDDPDCYIKNIKKFDIKEWKKYWSNNEFPKDIDILDLCYWNEDGSYDTAEESWRQRILLLREGRDPDYYDAVEWYLKNEYGLVLNDTNFSKEDIDQAEKDGLTEKEFIDAYAEKHDLTKLSSLKTWL